MRHFEINGDRENISALSTSQIGRGARLLRDIPTLRINEIDTRFVGDLEPKEILCSIIQSPLQEWLCLLVLGE